MLHYIAIAAAMIGGFCFALAIGEIVFEFLLSVSPRLRKVYRDFYRSCRGR